MHIDYCYFSKDKRQTPANAADPRAGNIVARRRTEPSGRPDSGPSAASDMLDRCMNWVVGALLVTSVAALVYLQAH
jgi:hypothetical protein